MGGQIDEHRVQDHAGQEVTLGAQNDLPHPEGPPHPVDVFTGIGEEKTDGENNPGNEDLEREPSPVVAEPEETPEDDQGHE